MFIGATIRIETLKWIDTGEDVRIVDWDFRNTNASDFKKNFKEMIQNP